MPEVTVAMPADRVSAEIALSLLHANRIPARMESLVEPSWTLGSRPGSLGDLRIVVPEDQAAEARALLGEAPPGEPPERRIGLEVLLLLALGVIAVLVAAVALRTP